MRTTPTSKNNSPRWLMLIFMLGLFSSTLIKGQEENPAVEGEEGPEEAPTEEAAEIDSGTGEEAAEEGPAEEGAAEEEAAGEEAAEEEAAEDEATEESGAEDEASAEANAADGETETEAEAEAEDVAEAEAEAEDGEVEETESAGDDEAATEGDEETADAEEAEEVADDTEDKTDEKEGKEEQDQPCDDDSEGECQEGSGDAENELSGADALAAELSECDKDGMDEKLAGCMDSLDSRIKTLEQAVLSGEGGGLEDQITLVLVKKGVIDCENDTQCDDDRACLDSYEQPNRMMCEKPCDRTRCDVPYSECIASDHEAHCECKEEFHGNGSVACIPNGFEEKNNSRSYRMFDNAYVDFDNATQQCRDLGARLPVLDTQETIDVVKDYMETYNFSVFEQWGKSSRRVWLGLIVDLSQGLIWVDGRPVRSYPVSSRLFVWEARRILMNEVSYAENSRHYALYIDGDLAKLPGGGRKGAAVLCELVPGQLQEPSVDPYDSYSRPSYSGSYGGPSQGNPVYNFDRGNPGRYPNYPSARGGR